MHAIARSEMDVNSKWALLSVTGAIGLGIGAVNEILQMLFLLCSIAGLIVNMYFTAKQGKDGDK